MGEAEIPVVKDEIAEKLDTLINKVSRLEFAILFVIILMFLLFILTLLLGR